MPHFHAPGPQAIARVSHLLGPLVDEIVFTGGAVVPLLATDVLITRFRETRDVDAIVEVTSRADYWRLEETVRSKGFEPDQREGAPIGRFITESVVLDLMPRDPKNLGFGNRWYEYAVDSATELEYPDGTTIHLVSAPAFVATKLEAFHGRGRGDYFGSHDLEDIVTVLDARPELSEEVSDTPHHVRVYLAHQASSLLQSDSFRDALPGHVAHGPATMGRVRLVVRRLEEISNLR